MQHAQYNFTWAIVLVALLCGPAWGGTIAHPTPPDPLLDGGAPGPCARLAAGADYAPGTDAAGNPVVPADAGSDPVPVPNSILLPLAQGGRGGQRNATGQGGFVELDGKKLAPLVNPPRCGR